MDGNEPRAKRILLAENALLRILDLSLKGDAKNTERLALAKLKIDAAKALLTVYVPKPRAQKAEPGGATPESLSEALTPKQIDSMVEERQKRNREAGKIGAPKAGPPMTRKPAEDPRHIGGHI